MHLRRGVLVFALLAVLCLVPLGSAVQVGVNYYHESMMSDQSKQAYIVVNLTQAGLDFNNIKTITPYVKFYMNPFVQGNLGWVNSLATLAKQKSMNVAVAMNVDDRILSDTNWNSYVLNVLTACQNLSGKADTLLVGNEISLHTTLSQPVIQSRILSLINSCKTYFKGNVSYEAFWYEKDYWKNYTGIIYFNMYENIDSFKFNLQELNSSFARNGYIGEWGQNQYNGSTLMSQNWQYNEISQRWSAIQQTSSPVAYIFAYQEPSSDGFGIVASNGTNLPIWNIFDQTKSILPVAAPNSSLLNSLVASCIYGGNVPCSKINDSISGDCRSIYFSTSSGLINLLACNKSTGIEVYRNSYPVNINFSACLASSCINEITGFVLVNSTTSVVSPVNLSIDKIPISCNVNGQVCSTKTDITSGSCRTVVSSSSGGDIKVLGCDKGNGWIELYLQQAPSGNYQFCFANGCVSNSNGFVRFQLNATQSVIQSTSPILNVSSLSVSVTPSGSKVGDYIEGSCRKVQFNSSEGWIEALICPKTDKYEMYFLSGTSYASICVGSSCVSSGSGFVSFK